MSMNRRRSKQKVKIPAKLGDRVLEPVNHKRTEIKKMVCDDEYRFSNDYSEEEVVVTSDVVGNDGIHVSSPHCDPQLPLDTPCSSTSLASLTTVSSKLLAILFPSLSMSQTSFNCSSALPSIKGGLVAKGFVAITLKCVRIGYARVLVEVQVNKGLPEKIHVLYKNSKNEKIQQKSFKVIYNWVPPMCSECSVFGHNQERFPKHANISTSEKESTKKGSVEDGFIKVVNKRATKQNDRMHQSQNNVHQSKNNNRRGVNIRNVYNSKVVNQRKNDDNNGGCNDKSVGMGDKTGRLNDQCNSSSMDNPSQTCKGLDEDCKLPLSFTTP
ncbi:hypothetical protein Tco_0589216 [Tanacetum coccineum]